MNSNPFPFSLRPVILSHAAAIFAFAAMAATVPAARAADVTVPVSWVPGAATVPPAAIVEQPLPPAAGQELEEAQPSLQHVRIPAHWRWQEGHYAWIPTHWELPPIPNATWVEPRWDHRGNGYVLAEGFWQQNAAPAVATARVAVPTKPAPPTVVVVNEPPPSAPPVREVIVERPSASHVWISGYWAWRGGRHVWIGGHWELPPRAHAVWVEPRWEHGGNGYVLVEGFWSDVGISVSVGAPRHEEVVVRQSPEVVVIREAPRGPIHEERGLRPSSHHIWVSGYWAWRDGRQVWIAGRWELPPHGHTVWVEPRWERRGDGYVFVEGVWR